MNSLYNWILNGTGRGKRYLLLLAVIFAAIISSALYFSWNAVLKTPDTQIILQNLPTLDLKNGQLIEPVNFFQDMTWSVPSTDNKLESYHLIIDTQSDIMPENRMPHDGIYVTRKNIYAVNNGNIHGQTLTNIPDFRIEQGGLYPILKNSNLRFSLMLFFTLALVLFITFYIWSLVYAILSYVLTIFIPGESYTFAARRRLSVVSIICGYIFVLPLAFWGVYTSIFMFFITVLLFMSILLAGLPKIFVISIDKQTKR